MSPIRLSLAFAWILCLAAIAHADDPHDLLKRVQTTVSARLPLVWEGALEIRYKDKKPVIKLTCCRLVRNGSETENWSNQSVPQDAPPFLMTSFELVNPFEAVSDAVMRSGTGKPTASLRDLGIEQIDGVDYEVVECTGTSEPIGQSPFTGMPITAKRIVRKFYIGKDGLVYRISGEVSWTEGNAQPGDKEAPAQTAQFALQVKSYRKAILFTPRPESQPPAQSLLLKRDGDPFPPPLALSPDGRLLAQGAPDGNIHLFDTATLQEKTVLKGHIERVTALAFSPDAKRLVSADPLVWAVWNTETGMLLYTLKDQPTDVRELLFAPDGNSVLAWANNGAVQLRDIATGKPLHTLDKQIRNRFAFSPDGVYLATVSGATVFLWNTRTWQETEIQIDSQTADGRIAFSPDSTRFALAIYSGVLYVYDVRSARRLQALKGALGGINTVGFSPDGRSITALDTDMRGDAPDFRTGLTTWDTTTWQV